MTDQPLENSSQNDPPAATATVLCRCTFTLSDVTDVWGELVDDDEAEIPRAILEAFLTSVRLVEDAMCERGFDAIRAVLEGIAVSQRQ